MSINYPAKGIQCQQHQPAQAGSYWVLKSWDHQHTSCNMQPKSHDLVQTHSHLTPVPYFPALIRCHHSVLEITKCSYSPNPKPCPLWAESRPPTPYPIKGNLGRNNSLLITSKRVLCLGLLVVPASLLTSMGCISICRKTRTWTQCSGAPNLHNSGKTGKNWHLYWVKYISIPHVHNFYPFPIITTNASCLLNCPMQVCLLEAVNRCSCT